MTSRPDRPQRGSGGESRGEPLETVTHARLRIAQGDRRGAIRLLRGILDRSPGHEQARLLLERVRGMSARVRAVEPCEERPPEPPAPGDVAELAGRFRRALSGGVSSRSSARIVRLERWLARIRREKRHGDN